MEGLTAREWYQFSLQTIAPLLLALSTWLGRKNLMRLPGRYVYAIILLGYIIVDAYDRYSRDTCKNRT